MSKIGSYRPWDTPEMRYQIQLVEDVEEFLGVHWDTLDLRLKRLFIELGRMIKVRAFERWLNTPYIFSPHSPTTPLDMILDGRIEYVIEHAKRYSDPGYR